MEEHQLHRAIRCAELIHKYLGAQISEEERMELECWVEESDANRQLFNELTDPEALNRSLKQMYSLNKWEAYNSLRTQLFPKSPGIVPVMSRWRYAAAAMFLGLVLTGTLFTYSTPRTGANLLAGIGKLVSDSQSRVTLDDGSVVPLDKLRAGDWIVDGEARIVKNKLGKIINKTGNLKNDHNKVHAVSASKDNSQEVQLGDGSTVLLQPASVVRYPAAFGGDNRKVAVAGEALFNVAKNEHNPFTVQVGEKLNVSVTDSQFTVKAQPTETVVSSPTIRVTVNSEGGVTISTDPGYELSAVINTDTGVITYQAIKKHSCPKCDKKK